MPSRKELLIVGCGSIGLRHVTTATQLGWHVRVMDPDRDRVARALEVDRGSVSAYTEDPGTWSGKPVIVATPTHTHTQVASKFLGRQNPILIEKPISDSLEDGIRFVDACDGKDRVYVACNLRFHPPVQALLKHLEKVGNPLFARSYFGYYLPYQRPGRDYREIYAAHKSMGGGVLLDAIHEVDYLIWFFGRPTSASGGGTKLSDLEMDVEDLGWINLRCGEVVCRIELDYLRRYRERGCEIVGDQGTLVWHSRSKPENCKVTFLPDAGAGHRGEEELLSGPVADIEYMEMLRCFLAGDPTHLLQTAADALVRLEATPQYLGRAIS